MAPAVRPCRPTAPSRPCGQYGVLSMDAHGNFNYVRNPGTPDGVQDVFNYTLADAQGATLIDAR